MPLSDPMGGMNDATVALQLLSHLEGDTLNVALLVPEVNRATQTGLVGALTLWTDAGCGRATQIPAFGGLSNRCRRGLYLVYTVDEQAYAPADRVVVAVTAPPARPSDLEALLCRQLPTTPVPTPPPQPKPTELEFYLLK